MRFWIRELAGWVLIGLGLYVFLACFDILYLPASRGPRLLESIPLTFIGFVLFRGGIHLLKVAMAARICLHAQADILRQREQRQSPAYKASSSDW
jgi:hypothetical protein